MYVDFAEAVSHRFSPRRLGPFPRPGHVGLLVAKGNLHEPFSRYSPVSLTPVAFHNHIAFTYYYRYVNLVIFNVVKCM
jgi:hypothetical protein